MGETYQDFLATQKIVKDEKPDVLPATVSTKNYEQATNILQQLKAVGIPTLITEGGLALKIDSETAYNNAQEVLAPFGLRVGAGDTSPANIRRELRLIESKSDIQDGKIGT